jgi:hypothetical protein
MSVVEVDQVLECLREPRARVGLEVGPDVVLELAQERRELRLIGWLDRDPGVVDDRGALGLEGRDRVVDDRADLGADRWVVGALAPDADPGAIEGIGVEELV